MAKRPEKEKAITLRKQGCSYSQIKQRVNVSKGTLSVWLRDMPLSQSRINELRASSPQRIERFRNTMAKKKSQRRERVYKKVAYDIENCTIPEFLAGFYLYWGEGTKTAEYTISFTNSDPAMVRCFLEWMSLLDGSCDKYKIKLHLYRDQDEDQLKIFWSRVTGIPLEHFYKTYIKNSFSYRKTYKGMFSHGTCVVVYHDRDTYEYIMAGIEYLRSKYRLP